MPLTKARAGDYNHRVAVKLRTPSQDDYGEEKTTWPTVMLIWAAIEPEFRPTDIYVATSAEHHYEQKIWFRTRNGRPFDRDTMRLNHNGADYEILAIQDPSGRNRELKLLCREIQEP